MADNDGVLACVGVFATGRALIVVGAVSAAPDVLEGIATL